MTQSNEANASARRNDNPTFRLPASADFLASRSVKQRLLEEQRAGWEAGKEARLEELIARWPGDPNVDPDAASLLFEEYCQRRRLGEQVAPEELGKRFPSQRKFLASLSFQQELLRSLGGENCGRSMLLALPSAGDELFGFQLRQELGRGSFARVFLAEQKSLAGRPVVAKVSAIEGDEPQTLAQLQHTNIVPIYSAHEDAATKLRLVCMPYFGGASLSRVLQALWAGVDSPTRGQQLVDALIVAGGPPAQSFKRESASAEQIERSRDAGCLPHLAGLSYVRASVWIIARLAEALQHAHQRGILHRDIKPSNVLLGADGQPMLLDFNLSENVASGQAQAAAALGGTVAYMAPEHLRALASRDPALVRQVDQRADIYGLGMVLYEMLTGRRPFDQSASYSPMPALIEAMAVERGQSAPSLRERRLDVPWSLESISRKCLAPNPADRYQHAEELGDDLRRFLEDRPLQYAPELSQRERAAKFVRRHPRLTQAAAFLSAAALLLAAGAGILAVTRAQLRAAHARTYEAEGAEARERKQTFTVGAERARILVNTTTGKPQQVREGLAVCEHALALYDILNQDDWHHHPAWQRLEGDDQRTLAEDSRELLLLLASGKVFLATAQAAAERPGEVAAILAPIASAAGSLNGLASLAAGRIPDSRKANHAEETRAALTEALALLDRAEQVPGLAASSALWHDRGLYLEKLGDASGAADARSKARALAPTSARDHYLLATAYARERRIDDAMAQLKQALELNPRDYWSLFLLGTLYEDRGEHALAYGAFSACIHLWPDFAWGYYNRGGVLRQLRLNHEAFEDYTASLKRDPGLAEAYISRGYLYLDPNLPQPMLALADFDAAAGLGRDDVALHRGRGIALDALHRVADADAAFDEAIERDPNNVDTLLSYGFAVSGRSPDKAFAAFGKVLERNPRNPRALYGCAMLLQRKSRRSGIALAYFNSALQVDPTFVAARLARANVLAYRGECAQAREDVDWCVKAEPSGATFYAAACVYALMADKASEAEGGVFVDRAVFLVQEAFRRGYGKDKAATDADLSHLRRHPDFRLLLRQVTETGAVQRGG